MIKGVGPVKAAAKAKPRAHLMSTVNVDLGSTVPRGHKQPDS